MVSVIKTFEFEAAHHLPDYNGVCKNIHGHTYKLEVEVVRTEEDEIRKGMVIDFKEMKEVIKDHIINKLDHTNLNLCFKTPTAEEIVKWIYNKLNEVFVEVRVIRVRLWETSTSCAEVKE